MKDRIKKLRRTLDLTQQEFADKIGVKRNTIGQYEIGRNEPIDSIINLICREFNVNETWLRTGEGEMFNPPPTDELDALAKAYGLKDDAKTLLEIFLNLETAEQDSVIRFIMDVADAIRESEYIAVPDDPSTPAIEDPNDLPAADHLDSLSIDERVALYRQELEREKKAGGGSGASQGSA